MNNPVALRWLQLQMTLDQFAKALAVFVFHINELDAATVRSEIADHGGEMNLAQAGANFQLNGIAYA